MLHSEYFCFFSIQTYIGYSLDGCCGYSLESPCWGYSNKVYFCGEIWKFIPKLSVTHVYHLSIVILARYVTICTVRYGQTSLDETCKCHLKRKPQFAGWYEGDIHIRASISAYMPWNVMDEINVTDEINNTSHQTESKCPTLMTLLTLFLENLGYFAPNHM